MNFKSKRNAFSLIELLIYVAIFSIVAGLMTGILTMVLKVNQKESAFAETTSQLNFVIQTIGRLVRESSNIEMATSTATSTLRLRMKDSAGGLTDRDPIVIWLDAPSQIIKMSEGTGANKKTDDLTDNKIIADKLLFTKFSQYPGHDTVSIDIQLTYNSINPNSRITRALQSAIARVSAATFDSDLLPGSGYTFSIGQSGSAWQRIFMSDGLPGSPSYTFSGNPNTGIFASSADALGFSTAGINRMIINNTGNIGIGTAGPESKLHIKTGTDQNIKFSSFVNGTNGTALTASNDVAANKNNFEIIANNIILTPTGGNVGIGTTAPGAKLEVIGGNDSPLLKIGSSASTEQFNFTRSSGTGALSIQGDQSGYNNILLAPVSGNVGIGTTNPGYPFEVTAGTTRSFLQPVAGNDVRFGSVSNSDLSFYTGGSERMRISGGNVGIGTVSPQAKLDVNGGVRIGQFSDVCGPNSGGTMRYYEIGTSSYFDICMRRPLGAGFTYQWETIK